nr:MAG TPA: major capsid protein [Caudoviricetes sp.]DAN81583.1 MAG TPA: major capsid protein [Caudoviricetes sp.]
MNQTFNQLERDAGIVFMGGSKKLLGDKIAAALAMDAQPGLTTVGNSGIPAWMLNYVDPQLIEIILQPTKAAEVFGEMKKGDWTTETATFMTVEPTGEVSSYGDYNNNGVSGVNVNFPQRQSYHYQVFTRWGEREVARAGEAKIDYVARVNEASVNALNRFQNKTYLFGVKGLQNYGVLNDPSLPAATTTAKTWANSTGEEVYESIRKLFQTLLKQTGGKIDMNTPLLLVCSPTASVDLTKTNQYNVNVIDQLKKNFPNLRVETIPEYSAISGETVQLIVEELDGQRTLDCAFTEKMRAHNMVLEASSIKQKKSQGTWGTIIYRPFCIATMTVS